MHQQTISESVDINNLGTEGPTTQFPSVPGSLSTLHDRRCMYLST